MPSATIRALPMETFALRRCNFKRRDCFFSTELKKRPSVAKVARKLSKINTEHLQGYWDENNLLE